ncbi:MAG: S1C family serine protease [Chloroflexota bacterium]
MSDAPPASPLRAYDAVADPDAKEAFDPVTASMNHRTRGAPALIGALTISGAAALVGPAAVLGSQGDDDIVISVIEQATPAVVTIQTLPGSFERGDGTSDPGDFELPEGLDLPEGFELPEGSQAPHSLEDLERLLPEGFQLPEDFQFPEGFQAPFGGPGGFGFRGGTGSGVIIGSDGLIITNGHVVGDAQQVRVILDDGTVLDGTVTGVDTLTDFAFVDVEAEDLPTATLGDSSTIKVGQVAISIGNPLGRFPSSASVGIISGLDRSIDVFGSGGGTRLDHLIQLDAAVNPGNSGGALFDGDGNLVGITTAQAGMSDGIGFALPIDLAKPIIEQARAGEPLSRPYIGVLYRELDAQVAADENLSVNDGAWIRPGLDGDQNPVVEGSPADDAGLQAGDIITAVDGLSVDRANPLDLQVLRFAPGAEITLSVLRGDETIDLPTTLGTRPADIGR